MKRYTVICEGRSEFVYIQRLQSFLDEQSTTGWSVPLRFMPIDNGGGFYGNIVSGYRAKRKHNKHARIKIWADYDLYARNDKGSMTLYLAKPLGIPDFKFSYHNFEDFLVLHMEDKKVQSWKEGVAASGHLTTPLHTKKYTELFANIMPNYQKGDLSPDFISEKSLRCLKQNIQNPIVPPPAEPHFGNFASFLIGEIDAVYPELLARQGRA